MTSRKSVTAAAVWALTGLAISAFASTSMAVGVAAGGATDAGQAPITNGEAEASTLLIENEGGVNGNDAFDSPTVFTAPEDDLFFIRGELSASDADGLCRDVDFFRIEGLEPLGEFIFFVGGDISLEAHLVWHNADGDQILTIGPGLGGKITLSSDMEGVISIAVSALIDGDFDGNDDETTDVHALCGEYYIYIEALLFGDVNGDSTVDVGDVRAMLNVFGAADEPRADLTKDGVVDVADLRILADTVNDRRAQRLANRKADRIERKQRRAEIKRQRRAEKAARRALRRR